jgi:hypothetical protein
MASIRELETGNWQAQIRRRGIKAIVRTFKTEAARWVRLHESEIDRGNSLTGQKRSGFRLPN